MIRNEREYRVSRAFRRRLLATRRSKRLTSRSSSPLPSVYQSTEASSDVNCKSPASTM